MINPSIQQQNTATTIATTAKLSEERLSELDEEEQGSQSDPSTSTGDLESSTGHSTRGSGIDSENELRRKIIQEEERNVRRARILVGIAFLACATAVTTAVYFFTKQSDQYAFEAEYDGFVKDIKALVKWEVRYNFALMEQLSSSITIASHLRGSTFPNHTDPEFEITGGFVDGMGGIMSAAFAPLVTADEKEQWEEYSVANQDWIKISAYLKAVHPTHRDALHGTIQDHEHDRRRRLQEQEPEVANTSNSNNATSSERSIAEDIYRWENGVQVPETNEPGKVFAPLWQVSPADHAAVNGNLLADECIKETYDVMRQVEHGVMSSQTEIGDVFDFLFDDSEKYQKKLPHAFILVPVFEDFVDTNPIHVGFIVGVTVMSNLFDRLLPEGTNGIIAVVKDSCGHALTYELNSGKASFLGEEDLHEKTFNKFERTEMNLEMYNGTLDGLCQHDLYLYPSQKFRDTFDTNRVVMYSSVVALAFVATAILLVVYDMMVNRRQNKVMKAASRTQAIVTSLFPKDIGRKLVEEAYKDSSSSNNKDNAWKKPALQTILGQDGQINTDANKGSKTPLADLFPEATVLFADIVGFTAWSSMREPSQVFILLETLYSAYDELAARRKVFKVETVGDCYVAVCGLPEPRPDHATVMVRFARDCLEAMHSKLNSLAIELGPDTVDLGMRVGLNSGPVTAGVLRGDRARFQLFGDTVNTCARLESTGAMNRIHVSQDTADLLIASGKKSWVTARHSKVNAKGKGLMQTYWINTKGDAATKATTIASNSDESLSSSNDHAITELSVPAITRDTRVVDWTCEILQSLLKEIVARRRSVGLRADDPMAIRALEQGIQGASGLPLDEVEQCFHLPKYTADKQAIDPLDVEIDSVVVAQLHDFVLSISEMYHNNPFHNFDHASHVTMSVVKLLKRIVAPTAATEGSDTQESLHDHTYGITSDPLTQFTVVLSALIHDVDHYGVPNAQLVQEEDRLAVHYKGKSVAEQNSVDVAWSLLMKDRFTQLRGVLYSTKDELGRFRQMLVHTVLATDIMDRELSQERKERWYQTFGTDETAMLTKATNSPQDEIDRKATIVIEHLMQASDVAHTMQHWHVYRKWNSRLFKEMYRAFQEGRSATDPSENWYQGELGFFDFYIIPLAQKLKSCGVFGVSSDEYLNYARQNRSEWESKGQEIVKELVMEVQA